ncbi:hypothetical protein TWF694_010392 [Orbilia ellipsospora]|uniref:Ubiquitin 3 binding protein But2 C-terminal domain-containing protein n=1 Tax=Orbilia ellipsospora TaxID=2528407 RepID=A0AAV9XAX0_9PEZI
MQLSTLILPLLTLASTLRATPVPVPKANLDKAVLESRATSYPSYPSDPTFRITEFYDQGTPHSQMVYISFKLTNPVTSQTTSCSFTTYTGGPIALTPFYTRCDKLGFGFGFELIQGGYMLTVEEKWNRDTVVQVGTVWLGNAANIKTRVDTANPNGNFQYFDVPHDFTIRANLWHT